MAVPIPQTIARLQPYISIKSILGGFDMESITSQAALSAAKTLTEIASIAELSIDIKRETTVWREFNSQRPGLPREVTPGLPTYELTLKKIMLNKDYNNKLSSANPENLLTLFGFNSWNMGFDILAQHQSVLIFVDLLSPTDAAGTSTPSGYPTTHTMVFYGCWFDALPMKFSLTAEKDMTIEQEVKAKAAGMVMA